jgi:hypothetical protein
MASCAEICRTISNGDRRALRGRKVRAHLRDCSACAAFASAIPTRSADLRALSPALPPAVTGLLLSQALGATASRSGAGAGSGAGGGGGGALGAGAAGKTTLVLTGAKVAATVAVAATATLGVAGAFKPGHATPVVPVRPASSSAVAHHAVSPGLSTRARVARALAVSRGVRSASATGPAEPASVSRHGSPSATTTRASRGHATSRSRSAAVVSAAPVAVSSQPVHGRGAANGAANGASNGASNGAAHRSPKASQGHGQGQGHGNGSPPGRTGSPPPRSTRAPALTGSANAAPVAHVLGNQDAPGLAIANPHRKAPDLPRSGA